MKKIAAAFLSLVLLSSVLWGCAKKSNSAETTEAGGTAAPTSHITQEADTDTTAFPAASSAETAFLPDENTGAETEEETDEETVVPDIETDGTIPRAVSAPVIDGNIGSGEWDDALVLTMDHSNTTDVMNTGIDFEGAVIRYLWDEEGLYILYEVKDTSPVSDFHPAGCGSYNSKDAAQLALFIDHDATELVNDALFFFSFCPKASDGKPCIGEHFVYGIGSAGSDVGDGRIASSFTEDGYIIEVMLDSDCLWYGSIALKKGTVLFFQNVILDENNGKQALFTDREWIRAEAAWKYALG